MLDYDKDRDFEKNPLSDGFHWERGSNKNGDIAYRLSHWIPSYD